VRSLLEPRTIPLVKGAPAKGVLSKGFLSEGLLSSLTLGASLFTVAVGSIPSEYEENNNDITKIAKSKTIEMILGLEKENEKEIAKSKTIEMILGLEKDNEKENIII
jgi:hypothetical protein